MRCNVWSMKLKHLASAFFLCALITVAADVTLACSCGPAPPVLDSFERAHAVVLARVVSIDLYKNQDNDDLTKFEKERLGDAGTLSKAVLSERYATRTSSIDHGH